MTLTEFVDVEVLSSVSGVADRMLWQLTGGIALANVLAWESL